MHIRAPGDKVTRHRLHLPERGTGNTNPLYPVLHNGPVTRGCAETVRSVAGDGKMVDGAAHPVDSTRAVPPEYRVGAAPGVGCPFKLPELLNQFITGYVTHYVSLPAGHCRGTISC